MNLKNVNKFQGYIHNDYLIPNWLGIKQYATQCVIPFNVESMISLVQDNLSFNPYIIGNASNLVLKNQLPIIVGTKKLNKIKIHDQNLIYCESGVLDQTIAKFYLDHSFTGAEFLNTIPGTLGGNIRSNAGCFNHTISDLIDSITYIDIKTGAVHSINDIKWEYRNANLPDHYLIISAYLKYQNGQNHMIQTTMSDYIDRRKKSQPTAARTAGSTFTNPENHSAWKLIDQVGLRGYSIGGAKYSEKNCNFIINFNNALPEDIEKLIIEAETRIMKKFCVKLKREIVII